MNKQHLVGVIAAAVAIAAAAWFYVKREDPGETVPVRMTALSPEAKTGQAPFIQYCGKCHGENGGGSAKGPPLIHRFYGPGHHPDGSFYAAIANGARQHHWRFGNMKPVEGVSEDEARAIVRFVREVQRANGIR
jgi:mono/diheme cytochrome c family protein